MKRRFCKTHPTSKLCILKCTFLPTSLHRKICTNSHKTNNMPNWNIYGNLGWMCSKQERLEVNKKIRDCVFLNNQYNPRITHPCIKSNMQLCGWTYCAHIKHAIFIYWILVHCLMNRQHFLIYFSQFAALLKYLLPVRDNLSFHPIPCIIHCFELNEIWCYFMWRDCWLGMCGIIFQYGKIWQQHDMDVKFGGRRTYFICGAIKQL